MRKRLWLALTFSLSLWGLTFPLMKIALEEAEPMTMALVRFGITFPFIFMWAYPIKDVKSYWDPRIKKHAFYIAILAIVLGNLFQNYGLRYTTAGMASILQEMAPLFTIFLALHFLKERINKLIVGGAFIAFIATALIFWSPTEEGAGTVFGNGLMILTALMYSFSGLNSKKAMGVSHPVTLSVMVHGFGLLLLLPITLALEPHGIAEIPAYEMQTWIALLILAILPTALGPIIWYYALREEPLSRISILTYIIPMFAIIFDYLITGTAIAPTALIFGAILITGVVIAQKGSEIARDEHGQHF